jgi:hypothetical protein
MTENAPLAGHWRMSTNDPLRTLALTGFDGSWRKFGRTDEPNILSGVA